MTESHQFSCITALTIVLIYTLTVFITFSSKNKLATLQANTNFQQIQKLQFSPSEKLIEKIENFPIRYNKKLNISDLLKTGEWKNFKSHGFERTKRKFGRTTILTPESQNYLEADRVWPWNSWQVQNYSGTYKHGSNKCVLKPVPLDVLDKCLGGGDIAVSGSSIARQIYTSSKIYMSGQNCCFQIPTTNHGHNVNVHLLHMNQTGYVAEVEVNTHYYFSTSFKRHKQGKDVLSSFSSGILNPHHTNSIQKQRYENLRILIISDHVLWILGRYELENPRTKKCDDAGLIMQKLVEKPLENLHKTLLTAVDNNLNLTIFLVPTNYVNRPCRELWWKWIDFYNEKLKQVAVRANHERVIFVESAVKMQKYPGHEWPLIVDGTHLNWRDAKKSKLPLPISPAHMAMLDLIFSVKCKDYFEIKTLDCETDV